MTDLVPEFSRRTPLDRIGAVPTPVTLAAGPEEREALARRFGLLSIDALSAKLTLRLESGAVLAEGTLQAGVTQSCVASGAAVPATLESPFVIRFVAEEGDAHVPDEIELDADECDMMPHDGQSVDLGEAVAQSLALALDPFPRAADADAILKAAGVLPEGTKTGPFAALAALKRPSA